MPRRSPEPLPPAVAVHLEVVDEPGTMTAIATRVAEAGGPGQDADDDAAGAVGRHRAR